MYTTSDICIYDAVRNGQYQVLGILCCSGPLLLHQGEQGMQCHLLYCLASSESASQLHPWLQPELAPVSLQVSSHQMIKPQRGWACGGAGAK